MQNKIKGIIYGQAIGDALGLGTEFMDKSDIKIYYSGWLSDYSQIVQDAHRRRWKPADWTDDTNQMLAILDSIVETNCVDPIAIAKHILAWYHSNGMGIGRTTSNVLNDPNFVIEPHSVAKKIWEQSGRQSAANGAIMRTSILGIWQYNNLAAVTDNTDRACRVTHCDPRSVGSCIVITTAIAMLLQGQTDIFKRITDLLEFWQINQYPIDTALSTYQLAEPRSMGYTLKPMFAAIRQLKYANSFEDGIIEVINEGGDADTNAAVAGALLGAKFGYEAIPERFKQLYNRKLLDEKIAQFINILQTE